MAKGTKTGGRKKGTPNRITNTVKGSVESVYQRLGGDDAMLKWAKVNPAEFYKLWGRLLPKQVNAEVTGKAGGPILVTEVIVRTRQEAKALLGLTDDPNPPDPAGPH